MNYISCNMQEFIEATKGKHILCFGGGSYFKVMCCDMSNAYPNIKIAGVIDNDESKCGRAVYSAGFKTEIMSFKKTLCRFNFKDTVILITALKVNEIIKQIKEIEALAEADVYSYLDIKINSATPMEKVTTETELPLIPKTIHYCWFGGGEIPMKMRECMETWRIYCPDFEIKKWDETNICFDENEYLRTTYNMKKWSRMSNYVRLYAVYNEGGIYFDTDVELVRSPEVLRYNHGFIATSSTGAVNSGSGFGAARHNSVIRDLMSIYENISDFNVFLSSTNTGWETELFHSKGYCVNGKKQIINNFTIYPWYVLPSRHYDDMPLDKEVSISIHHEYGSWR